MRRALGLVVVAALMAASSVALASEPYANYLDQWNEVSYAGSDGSLKWGSAWSEFGDDNRPESGILHVYTDNYCADYKCLHIEGRGDDVTFGVKRFADLSVFQEADICFELTGHVDEESDGQLLVQVTTDGSSWKTVASYELSALGGYFHPQIDLTDFRAKSFGVKFSVVGVFYGELFLDTVELKGLLGSSTTSSSTTSTSAPTTTTTTKPIPTTSTSSSTTSTTKPRETTTTQPSPPSTDRGTTTQSDSTSTTTIAEETTTTLVAVPVGPVSPPPDSGLRQTGQGVQANFASDLYGHMDMDGPEVLGVEIQADYSMAVELISASWIWLIALILLIATAIVSGLDRRRSERGAAPA